MGTRSNTYVIETGSDKPFVLLNMYRPFDGYLRGGHGEQLAEFISGLTLCNGIGATGENVSLANGAGCFAAQLVAHFKDGAGGFYIDRPLLRFENDYTYIVRIDTYNPSKGFEIEVREWRKQIFKGNAEEFLAFTKEQK